MAMTSPLNEVAGYSDIVAYFSEHKDENINSWLEYETTFEKPGKQGLVGIFRLKNDPGNRRVVFKISQYINHLIPHEYRIMKGLTELSPYCPHFCKSVGVLETKVDPKSRKSGNPFEIQSKYPIKKEILLCEHIDKSSKFYTYIKSPNVSEDILFSTIKQVLIATIIAQNKKQFTHYDLHSENIMMKKCNKDVVFLYVIDEENQFAVPTHGHYPIIIDYGFSYINDMEDNPLFASMAHTDIGFMSDHFDWVADPKLFLVTVSGEIKERRKSKMAKKFRRIVKNVFHPLEIDWSSGWDDFDDKGVDQYVTELVEGLSKGSALFQEYDHYCIDLLQSLIILPLEKHSHDDMARSYSAFITEWIKIEREITNPFYSLYILKSVVDNARFYRPYYMRKATQKQAVVDFQRAIYASIDEITSFCRPKNVDFEKMLCSLLIYSRCVEGVYYDVITAKMLCKEASYNKLPLQSTSQIYGAVEANIPDNYVYGPDTTVFVFDCINEKTDIYKPDLEVMEGINEVHPLARGTFIYDLYKQSAAEKLSI